MGSKAEYRSAIRSRKLIKTAFMELAAEKEISKITVKDIADRADINRGTFYAHYRDVYDVLEQIEDEAIENLSHFLDNLNNSVENIGDMMHPIDCYLNKDIKLSQRLLNSRESEMFFKKLHKVFKEKLLSNEGYTKIFEGDPLSQEICTTFITYGCAGVLQNCMQHREFYSPETVNQALNQFIEGGILAFGQNNKTMD